MMIFDRIRALPGDAGWAVQKRRSLTWFVFLAAGTWGAFALPFRPVAWALAASLALGLLWAWRRRSDRQWGFGFIIFLTLIAGLITAQRLDDYERWEAHFPRGERKTLRARIVDVQPYGGDRVALLARDLDVTQPVGTGRLWVRVVAPVSDLLALLTHLPPNEDGTVEWPVRVYPFSPRGNPGEFDARMWAMRRGYLATAYPDVPRAGFDYVGRDGDRLDPGSGLGPDSGPLDPCALSDVVRRIYRELGLRSKLRETAWRWRCRLSRGSTEDAAAIAVAVVLGQKDLIDDGLQEAFSRSGLGHLLAVSGLHVGFVLAMAVPMIHKATGLSRRPRPGKTRLREWVGYLILCLVVFGFVGLVGGPPSAVRAGIMAAVGLGAATWRRQIDSWQTLGIAGSALLLTQPLLLFDLGFQMSFLAVAGILTALSLRSAAPAEGGWIDRFFGGPSLRRVVRIAGDSLSITLGAQIATAPVVAYAFSSFSWISPLVNLAAVPIGGGAVGLLAAGVVVGEVWPWLGDAAIRIGHLLLDGLIFLARIAAPWGAWEVAMPSPAAVAGWYALFSGGALYLRALRRPCPPWMIRWGKGAVTAGVVLLAVALSMPSVKGMLGVAEVWVLDVGQGDSILVQSGWGRAVIVDGGGVPGAAATGGYDVGARRVVPALKKLGVRRLQAAINTHPHEDHVHGLGAVIASRSVDAVYASAAPSTGAAYRAFLTAARQRGLPVQRLSVGQTLWLEPGFGLTVLAGGDLSEWDTLDPSGRLPSLNDRSVALLLRHPRGSMLLLGDLEARGQRRLLVQAQRFGEPAINDVDVLLLPHHGDRVTAQTGLLDVVRPKAAIVSVGPNRYGHPAPELLETLSAREIPLWRTDRHGAIRVQFWPWGVRISGLRGGPQRGGSL